MASDPARTSMLTKKERMKRNQDACKREPCGSVTLGFPKCPFCIYWPKILRSDEARLKED